ncbi:apolipoprotein L3-like [Argopecten irradians]|uniref:apolipoprotein L3-like n=1 Tax=Argopecten irradians TaxID=31199 RepID=UPI0037242874
MASEDLKIKLEKWRKVRTETVTKLRQLADDLDQMEKRANISQAAGTSASIVSGVGAIVCFGLAFATAGISIIPGIVFTAIGGSGGITSLGASVGKHFHQKNLLKQVQQCLENDRKLSERMNETIARINVSWTLKSSLGGGKVIARGVSGGADIAEAANIGVKTTARSVSKVASIVVFAFDVLLLPVDIYILVDTSIKLHKGSTNEAAAKVRKVAEDLEKEINETFYLKI